MSLLLTSSEQTGFISGPSGQLEAVVSQPFKQKLCVLCHPHPLGGGNMHNKVIFFLARSFQQNQITTARFNYRGVGQSDGVYDGGEGESDDLQAVLDSLSAAHPFDQIILLGFSFGTYVAQKVAATTTSAIDYLLSIAPAVTRTPLAKLPRPACPWCVVIPEADEIVDTTAQKQWAAQLIPSPAIVTFPNTSHFFHGQLPRLRDELWHWLSTQDGF